MIQRNTNRICCEVYIFKGGKETEEKEIIKRVSAKIRSIRSSLTLDLTLGLSVTEIHRYIKQVSKLLILSSDISSFQILSSEFIVDKDSLQARLHPHLEP